jgi:hypothetical protein
LFSEETVSLSEQIPQTTAKHTTMVTMDYVFNEDQDLDEQTEDVTEATKEDSTKNLQRILNGSPPTDDHHQRIFGAEMDETTPEIAANHSVQWLTENGDILVPIVDHETTTMMKIGHLDNSDKSDNSDIETTPRIAAEEESSFKDLSQNILFSEATTTTTTTTTEEANQNIEWTTEAPLEVVPEHGVDVKNVADIETTTTTTTEEEVPSSTEQRDLTATTTTTTTTAEPSVQFFEETEQPTLEETSFKPATESILSEENTETSFEVKSEQNSSETTESVKSEQSSSETVETTEPVKSEEAPEVEVKVREEPEDQSQITTEPSSSQIEITFAMDGHKDMPEEFHEMLADSITNLVHEMTTTTLSPETDMKTTTLTPEEEIADEYNTALLAKETAVQVRISKRLIFFFT